MQCSSSWDIDIDDLDVLSGTEGHLRILLVVRAARLQDAASAIMQNEMSRKSSSKGKHLWLASAIIAEQTAYNPCWRHMMEGSAACFFERVDYGKS